MLSPFTRISRMILKRRQKLQLSQRQVASQVGCSQAYLAQVETGKRPVSKKIAEKLEAVLRVKAGKYTRAEFRRGRPPLSPAKRRAADKRREAKGLRPARVRVVKPS